MNGWTFPTIPAEMTRDQTEPLIETREFRIGGLVQGVGFRPFVKRLAESHRIVGWVKNEASYVSVLATGRPDQLDLFAMGLVSDAPPFRGRSSSSI